MSASPSQNLSVLLVDDNRDAADSLAEVLTFFEYDVRIVYGAADALAAEPADVVILELRLPRMSGWDLVRRMRERGTEKQPLYIAVTTCGRTEDRFRSEEAGIDIHLVKPVDPGVLVGVLRRFVRALAPAMTGA